MQVAGSSDLGQDSQTSNFASLGVYSGAGQVSEHASAPATGKRRLRPVAASVCTHGGFTGASCGWDSAYTLRPVGASFVEKLQGPTRVLGARRGIAVFVRGSRAYIEIDAGSREGTIEALFCQAGQDAPPTES